MSPWGWLLFCTVSAFVAMVVVAAAAGLWESVKKYKKEED